VKLTPLQKKRLNNAREAAGEITLFIFYIIVVLFLLVC
jgi:hypothetical protein